MVSRKSSIRPKKIGAFQQRAREIGGSPPESTESNWPAPAAAKPGQVLQIDGPLQPVPSVK
jgi:hypothetical protein